MTTAHADKSGLYSPAQAAAVLGCSEWWVKEQARRRRIPFTWIGGSYRFTAEHLVEIVGIFEVRPIGEGEGRAAARRRPASPADESAPRLVAKRPRRTRRSGSSAAA